MSVFDDLRRFAGVFRRTEPPQADVSASSAPSTPAEVGAPGAPGREFWRTPGDRAVSSMTIEELAAWENDGVPSVTRASDCAEAHADEKQDATTSANFP